MSYLNGPCCRITCTCASWISGFHTDFDGCLNLKGHCELNVRDTISNFTSFYETIIERLPAAKPDSPVSSGEP